MGYSKKKKVVIETEILSLGSNIDPVTYISIFFYKKFMNPNLLKTNKSKQTILLFLELCVTL